MKWEISAICLRLPCVYHSFVHQILATSFNSLESCVFIWLCSSTFFSFSACAEVWRVRLNWMLRRRLSLAWRSHVWFHSLTLCELDLLVDLTSRSRITCISLSFEHLIACDEFRLCHSVFWSWSTSALCSWCRATQWVNTSSNRYSRFSSICIVLLSESFWTASNDTCVLRMRWINSSVPRSVLRDRLKRSVWNIWSARRFVCFYSSDCLLHFVFCDAWIEWNCQRYEWFCDVTDVRLRRWEKELSSQYLDFFLERRYHMIDVASLQWRKLRKLFK